jgi:hypothetical protein
MQENPLLAIRGALHMEQSLELRILIFTNEATVAYDGLCYTVNIIQMEKPDLTVNTIEPCTCTRQERKASNIECIDCRLISNMYSGTKLQTRYGDTEGFRSRALLKDC